jgi:preprotein translocase subunit SecG
VTTTTAVVIVAIIVVIGVVGAILVARSRRRKLQASSRMGLPDLGVLSADDSDGPEADQTRTSSVAKPQPRR